MSKIVELIANEKALSFSYEMTPDISEQEILNVQVEPLFYSVTWHAKSHQCKSLDVPPLKTACLLRKLNKNVLLHLACDYLQKDYLMQLLAKLQNEGICNLLVVLGGKERYDTTTSDFKSSQELIQEIRKLTDDYFCIGVAGFPDDGGRKLNHLKEKIDCGANFILTQAFFDATIFKDFVEKCKALGIEVPIIPGLFPFENSEQLLSFVNLCRVKVTNDFLNYVKNNEHETNRVGIDVVKRIIENVNNLTSTRHFHFFTINKLERVYNLLNKLN